jgi:hypothetical protein
LGVSTLPVSPTVMVVALLLPFASLYYGFSQQGRHHETAKERSEQLAHEEAALERKLLRAGVQAARGAASDPEAVTMETEEDLATIASRTGHLTAGEQSDPFA